MICVPQEENSTGALCGRLSTSAEAVASAGGGKVGAVVRWAVRLLLLLTLFLPCSLFSPLLLILLPASYSVPHPQWNKYPWYVWRFGYLLRVEAGLGVYR